MKLGSVPENDGSFVRQAALAGAILRDRTFFLGAPGYAAPRFVLT